MTIHVSNFGEKWNFTSTKFVSSENILWAILINGFYGEYISCELVEFLLHKIVKHKLFLFVIIPVSWKGLNVLLLLLRKN